MKKSRKLLSALLCVSVCTAALFGCNNTDGSELLGKPKETTPLSSSERGGEGLAAMRESAEIFAARFTESVLRDADTNKNHTVSPVSVYMALSLASACAQGDTREEIVAALGVSYDFLEANFSDYFRSLTAEYRNDAGELTGLIKLGNSVWLNEGTAFKQPCVDLLAQKYHCYSYAADFRTDNRNANLAVRNFVKEQTRGLIDQDFDLSEDTAFSLINTLYLKDIWNFDGEDLSFTAEPMAFRNTDGTVTQKKLLESGYSAGRVYSFERFDSFFVTTINGAQLKFIVPKDGYTVSEVFGGGSIAEVNAITDYNAWDPEEQVGYFTRCIFPAFDAAFDKNVAPFLQREFAIDKMFDEGEADFSAMTPEHVYCSKVQHVTKLEVDESGIEGAAVTVVVNDATSAPPYEKVFEDFIVDRAFGFILTDCYGNTLFTGIVNQI